MMPRYSEARAVIPRKERRELMRRARKLLGKRPVTEGDYLSGFSPIEWTIYLPTPWGTIRAMVVPERVPEPDGDVLEAHVSAVALRPLPDRDGKALVVDGRTQVEETVPTWHELVILRSLIWPDECEVRQILPKQSEFVNHHHAVLHLWGPLPRDVATDAQGAQ